MSKRLKKLMIRITFFVIVINISENAKSAILLRLKLKPL